MILAGIVAALALGATPPRYLALGDSYTIGESVPEVQRWPVQLAASLQIDAPTIVARTGWTTDELDDAINHAKLKPPYDLVSLLIGVNNQYRGRPLAEYEHQFETLLRRAIGFAGGKPGRVFVVAIPDWGVTPFAHGRDGAKIARELDAFNAAAQKICAKHGVAFVDIAPIYRERGREAAMLSGDGLHPSGAMYALWAAQALPTVAEMLR